MLTFVLIHGSWHDGSAWNPVALHLQSLGHKVFTPTMVGHGKGVEKAGVTHARCTASIVDYIVKKDLDNFVLVGHSFGGTIVCKMAEFMPERIRRMVFWNAFVLKDGNSLNDECPPHYRDLFDRVVLDSPDYTVMLPFSIWKDAFINDADPQLAKAAYDTLSAEPYMPFQEKLDLKRFYSLEIPRSYLNCMQDIALPPGEWGWHPRMSSRLGSFRLVEMPGSHEVLFTNPRGLAQKLIEGGRD